MAFSQAPFFGQVLNLFFSSVLSFVRSTLFHLLPTAAIPAELYNIIPLQHVASKDLPYRIFNKAHKAKKLMFCFQSIFRPNNMIAQSQSGTGKTAAFVLSMLSRVDATKGFTQVKFKNYLLS